MYIFHLNDINIEIENFNEVLDANGHLTMNIASNALNEAPSLNNIREIMTNDVIHMSITDDENNVLWQSDAYRISIATINYNMTGKYFGMSCVLPETDIQTEEEKGVEAIAFDEAGNEIEYDPQ